MAGFSHFWKSDDPPPSGEEDQENEASLGHRLPPRWLNSYCMLHWKLASLYWHCVPYLLEFDLDPDDGSDDDRASEFE